jgi:hypothetical protein
LYSIFNHCPILRSITSCAVQLVQVQSFSTCRTGGTIYSLVFQEAAVGDWRSHRTRGVILRKENRVVHPLDLFHHLRQLFLKHLVLVQTDHPTYLAQRERIIEGMRKAGVPEG